MTDRVYQDYEPYCEWVRDERRYTVMVPGYKRDQLKIQVTSKPALRISGERLIFQNRWRRFQLEYPIPSDCDTDNVTATFEGGKLSVTFAKREKPKETINPSEEAPKPKESINPTEEAPKPKETINPTEEDPKPMESINPTEEAPKPNEPSQKVDEQKTAQEDTPKAEGDKAKAKTNEVSDQKTPQKEKEPVGETEKSKAETDASTDKVAGGVRTNGLTETAIPQAPKTKEAKSVTRSKTRVIDFSLCNQVENKALGDFARGIDKWKNLIIWVLLILLVVGLVLYNRKSLTSSQEESNLEEGLLFDPY